MVVHGSPWGKPLADTDRRAPQRTNVDPRSIAGRARSIVLAEPRWLDIVTWRLIAAAIGVAVAFTLPYLPEPAVNPMARPYVGMLLLSRVATGVTIVLTGALLDGPKPPWRRPFALAVAVATACIVGATLLVAAGDPYPRFYGAYGDAAWIFKVLSVARGLWPTWALAAAAWYFMDRAAHRAALLRQEEVSRDQLVARMLEARLQMLEAQVEPHFIFNTLANVKRLCQIDPARARRMVDRFVIYLRASLPQMRNAGATLGREVDFAVAYLGVQKVRMGRRLVYTVDVPDALRPLAFPPMMLISLVENAVKHGLNPSIDGGTIRIGAAVLDDVLRVDVADTGCGFGTSMGGGVGLSNIRARLTAMYGRGARLALTANSPQGVVASVELPSGERPVDRPAAAEAVSGA